MVTKNSHSPVGPVIGQDLGRNVFIRYRGTEQNKFSVWRMIHDIHFQIKVNYQSKTSQICAILIFHLKSSWGLRSCAYGGRHTTCEFFQLLLQGDRGIVCTENFGCQTIHQLLKVLVENRCLREQRDLGQEPSYKMNYDGNFAKRNRLGNV